MSAALPLDQVVDGLLEGTANLDGLVIVAGDDPKLLRDVTRDDLIRHDDWLKADLVAAQAEAHALRGMLNSGDYRSVRQWLAGGPR